MAKHTMIGIIGDDEDALDILHMGLKEYFCDRMVLITDVRSAEKTMSMEKDLRKRHDIDVRITKIKNLASLEEIFTKVRQIKEEEDRACIINVETDYRSSCLALSSAFVNGIPAIGILDGKMFAYPIMKFSYYSALNEKRVRIMGQLDENWMGLEELKKRLKMSAPLISYHLHGNLKSKGLEEMGLVETKEDKRRMSVRLSTLGKLLVRGFIECAK